MSEPLLYRVSLDLISFRAIELQFNSRSKLDVMDDALRHHNCRRVKFELVIYTIIEFTRSPRTQISEDHI